MIEMLFSPLLNLYKINYIHTLLIGQEGMRQDKADWVKARHISHPIWWLTKTEIMNSCLDILGHQISKGYNFPV